MHTARARFSELLKSAQKSPQDITRSGKSVAVVLSRELFDRLSDGEQSLVDFMRASPLAGRDEVDFDRDRSQASLSRDLSF